MIRLAPLTPDDRAALLDLWVEAWTAAMPQIDFAARRGWVDGRLDDLLRDGALLIGGFDASGALLGFLTLQAATGEIDQLCVAPRAQGHGVARRLMDEARRRAPQGLHLTVNLDNARALRFYEAQGFHRGDEARNALSGLPTVAMVWRPTPPP